MVASQHNYTPQNITFQKCHNLQNAPAKQLTRKVFFVRMSLHEALKSKGLRRAVTVAIASYTVCSGGREPDCL